jgi:hypothetical protein
VPDRRVEACASQLGPAQDPRVVPSSAGQSGQREQLVRGSAEKQLPKG